VRAKVTAFADAVLANFSRPLLQHIDDVDAQIERANANVGSAAGAAKLDAAHDLAALSERADRLYALTAEQLELMEELGMSTERLRGELESRLRRRAELVSGRIRLAQEDRDRLRARLEIGEDDSTKAELAVIETRLAAGVESLGSTIDQMKALDLDASEYQQQLIGATGALNAESLDAGVLWSLLRDWAAQARQVVADNGLNVVLKILVFAALLTAFRFLAAMTRKLVTRAIDGSRLNVSALLRDMLIRSAGSAMMFAGILVALAQLGISVGPLIAGLGIAGFIIGFALQDTLSNFASGMMILLYRPFDVGDVVEAGGVAGKVSQMNLVSTTILTFDHQTMVVPNSKIWGDVIRNVTAQKTRRVDMTFGIGYGDDVAHAERVLKDIVDKHEKTLSDPAPVIELHSLGDSSVDFVVRPWAKTEDYWRVYWDVTRAVKMRFDAEGISIPFPQRDLHIHHAAAANDDSRAEDGDSAESEARAF
jgi:small conductance mechanosensitive channel